MTKKPTAHNIKRIGEGDTRAKELAAELGFEPVNFQEQVEKDRISRLKTFPRPDLLENKEKEDWHNFISCHPAQASFEDGYFDCLAHDGWDVDLWLPKNLEGEENG